MFFWNSLDFLMIQRMLAIWSLVPLPFLKPAWTSGSSWFTFCWSFSSVQFSGSVVSDSLRPQGLQHARPPCPSPTWSLPKLMSIEWLMPSNHLILCRPLLLPPSIFPSSRGFLDESVLCVPFLCTVSKVLLQWRCWATRGLLFPTSLPHPAL